MQEVLLSDHAMLVLLRSLALSTVTLCSALGATPVPDIAQLASYPSNVTGLVNGYALLPGALENGGLISKSGYGTEILLATGATNRIVCNDRVCYFGTISTGPAVPGRLWRTDGTRRGTVQLASYDNSTVYVLGLAGSYAYAQIIGTDRRIIEVAVDGSLTSIFQGTPDHFAASEQTVAFVDQANRRVTRIDRGSAPLTLDHYVPNGLDRPVAVIGSTILFAGETQSTGVELWLHRTGDLASTLISDFVPGANGSSPDWLTPFGAGVYFSAASRLYRLEPPFTTPVLELNNQAWASFLQVGNRGLAFLARGGNGFMDVFLAPSFGAPPINVSGFSAGAFELFTEFQFGFIGKAFVFGARAELVPTNLGREPYFSGGLAGDALLLADLTPGASDSNPRAMSSDGERALFATANATWHVGAPLVGIFRDGFD